jgi:hypothetical protein
MMPFAVFKPGRFQDAADRGSVRTDDLHRLPIALGDFLDRLRRLLRRGGTEEQVGTRILDPEGLRIDGRIGHFVRSLRDHHLGSLVAEARSNVR